MGIPHYTLYLVVVTAQSERARDAISARVAWPRATRARMEERVARSSYHHFGASSNSLNLRDYSRLAVVAQNPSEAITRPKGLEATRAVRRALSACLAYLCEDPVGTVYVPRGASENDQVHILVPLVVMKGLWRTREAL